MTTPIELTVTKHLKPFTISGDTALVEEIIANLRRELHIILEIIRPARGGIVTLVYYDYGKDEQ